MNLYQIREDIDSIIFHQYRAGGRFVCLNADNAAKK